MIIIIIEILIIIIRMFKQNNNIDEDNELKNQFSILISNKYKLPLKLVKKNSHFSILNII